MCAGVAQLVEQLTCNQQVVGSTPIASSILKGVSDKTADLATSSSHHSPVT